jgi:hypothetical protein
MFIKKMQHRLFSLRRRGREMRLMWKIKCLLKIYSTAPFPSGKELEEGAG